MNLPVNVTQNELMDILLNIALDRPVFIWGAPGIGKSALVGAFADAVGLPCVSLLGSQLAPEDIIGIPQIRGNTSEFLPPKMIAFSNQSGCVLLQIGCAGNGRDERSEIISWISYRFTLSRIQNYTII